MTASNSDAAPLAHPLIERDLVVERTIAAPRALVFAAWTDPAKLAQWFGPRGFNTRVLELDARPGGALRCVMCGPDNQDHPFRGIYREVDEPSRIVFTTTIENDAGTVFLEIENTVTFAEAGSGETLLRMQAHVLRATAEAENPLNGMEEGWDETLDRLAEFAIRG